MKVELVRRFFFEAAHRNPNGNDAQQRLHGHSYRLEIIAAGQVESSCGWLIDFADIKAAVEPCVSRLDHQYLNDIPDFANPTVPVLRSWVVEHVRPNLPCLKDARISIVGDCAFRPVQLFADPAQDLPARWRFTFEAAQSLPQLPEEHQCRRLHGHSYRIEVGARGMEEIAPDLKATYALLDHRCLNDVDGLAGTTCEHLCEWLWERLSSTGHALTAVVVQETETARCVYYGR